MTEPPLPPPQPPQAFRTSNAAVLVIVGGVAAVIGSFLPWITVTAPFVGSVSRSGLDAGGDGVITLALGAIIAIVGFVNREQMSRGNAIGTLLMSGIVLVVAFVDFGDITDRIDQVGSEFAAGSVGIGIWALFAGGAVAAVGSLMALSENR